MIPQYEVNTLDLTFVSPVMGATIPGSRGYLYSYFSSRIDSRGGNSSLSGQPEFGCCVYPIPATVWVQSLSTSSHIAIIGSWFICGMERLEWGWKLVYCLCVQSDSLCQFELFVSSGRSYNHLVPELKYKKEIYINKN